MLGRTFLRTSIVGAPLWIVSSLALAQSTPSEFGEMSLSELFHQSIDDSSGDAPKKSPWTFALQYKFVEFDGYIDGSDEHSHQDVLWSGPSELRTEDNFPIVPTVICQKATVASIGYQFNRQWRAHITIPHVKQSTDHISSVADYDEFNITTSGIGDIVVSGSYKLVDTAASSWWLSVGLSLPTGSIDEKGDTPREPGNQQLPYTMQLGAGTYDIPLELNYQNLGPQDYSLNFTGIIRTGTNDRGYRLGNNFSLTGLYKFHPHPLLEPFVSLSYQYGDSIRGQDTSLLVAGPYPYPAGITNPDYYGGYKFGIKAGFSWQVTKYFRFSAALGKPLYQNLNGPQPKENWRSSFQISRNI